MRTPAIALLASLALAGCGSSSTANSTTQTVSARAKRLNAALAKNKICAKAVVVSQGGTCALGEIIRREYIAAPGTSITVREPNGSSAALRCKVTYGIVGCSGADGLQIAFTR